jgi:redox-sensitive bicupin YhaK (pirin superfamily)
MGQVRNIKQVVTGVPTTDGAGVNLTRIIGTRQLLDLNPFLLLDEFRSDDADDYIAGFPLHPHRGFETITYLIAGAFHHQDSRGNEGHLTAGSIQWMTAGRGIIHSEMPEMTEGLVWGYQLWLNLPARDKMMEPRYQDIPPERIPVVEHEGATVKVLAGEYRGTRGPAETRIPALYLDVKLGPDTVFEQPVPTGMTAFVYVMEGQGLSAGEGNGAAKAGQLLVLRDGEQVRIQSGEGPVRFLLVAAERLGEPIARRGPFVMNTEEEIYQAFRDYQEGVLDK